MKRPILITNTLAEQEALFRAIYALNRGVYFNNRKTVDSGWTSWFSNYTSNGQPCYRHVFVRDKMISPTTFTAEGWANLNPVYIKVNSTRQFIAYLEANLPPPAPAPKPVDPFENDGPF
jgi:hypothetical protein